MTTTSTRKSKHDYLEYATLDVFTSTTYSGNQLGLVKIPSSPNPSTSTSISPTQSQKQLMAREFDYPETVFLHEQEVDDDGEPFRRLEIFTRFQEILFAGHPVIGAAAYVLQHLQYQQQKEVKEVGDRVTFLTKVGKINLRMDGETGLISGEIPSSMFRVHRDVVSRDDVVTCHTELSSVRENLLEENPAVSIAKNMTFTMIDLSNSPESLGSLKPSKPPEVELDDGFEYQNIPGVVGTMFFCAEKEATVGRGREREKYQVRRFMVDGVEDAATGSAACAFAGWKALGHGERNGTYAFEIEQGVAMGRKSNIFVDVELDDDGSGLKRIVLAGEAVTVMAGRLPVPDMGP